MTYLLVAIDWDDREPVVSFTVFDDAFQWAENYVKKQDRTLELYRLQDGTRPEYLGHFWKKGWEPYEC